MLDKHDFPGKPNDVQEFQLDFWITPVMVIDGNIYHANTIQQFFASQLDFKLAFFPELLFEIELDNQTVFTTNFLSLDTIHITKIINDLVSKDHELCFKLQGKNNNHSCFLGDDKKSVTCSVQINFEIEHLPTKTLFYEYGKYITDEHGVQSSSTLMGQNGKQLLNFPSPIYPWLLANKKFIFSDLGSKI